MHSLFASFDEPSEYSRAFLSSVPRKLLLDIPRLIHLATKQAFERDTELLPGTRRDMYPIVRRALVETSLFSLGAKYARDGVRAFERKNKSKNYSHIELTSGRVAIIAHAVECEGDSVREAAYRQSLAQKPQLALWNHDGEESEAVADALLAVVLYGPSSSYPRTSSEAGPGFVVVRFPSSDWSSYAEGRVNLLARFDGGAGPGAASQGRVALTAQKVTS